MNYNQNHKTAQIIPETLIIGLDIAKHSLFFRKFVTIESLN